MLAFFKSLKSLTLEFESSRRDPVESPNDLVDNESASSTDNKMLPSLDTLAFRITFFHTAGDFALLEEIKSCWPRIRRLTFDLEVIYYDDTDDLETVLKSASLP